MLSEGRLKPLAGEIHPYIDREYNRIKEREYQNWLLELGVCFNRKRVLDVGCGPASQWLISASKLGATLLVGSDIELNFLIFARELVKEFNISAGNWVQSRAEHLPFKSECFDIVICSGVLPFVADDRLVIKETIRVLKKGGIGLFNIGLINYFLKTFLASPFPKQLIRRSASILSTILYELTGKKFYLNTFQTFGWMRKKINRNGGKIIAERRQGSKIATILFVKL